jgi:hypothetical protein
MVFGTALMLVINPLAVVGEFGVTPGTVDPAGMTAGQIAGGVGQGFGALMGNVSFVLGANTTMNYGPNVTIHRGTTISYNGDLSAWMTPLAIATAVVYFASGAVPGFLPTQVDKMATAFSTLGAASIMLALLSGLEVKAAYEENFAAKTAEAANLAQQIKASSLLVARSIAQAASDRSQEALQLIDRSVGQYPQQPALPPDSVHSYRTNYTVNAYDITLNSAADPSLANPGLVLPPSTSINITAQGQGPGHTTGILSLSGTQTATLGSGGAGLDLANGGGQSTALLRYSAGGSLTLQLGNLPATTQKILLAGGGITVQDQSNPILIKANANTITLQSGLLAPALCTITLAANGTISLSGSTINLQALNGINLSVDGGANQIQINNRGVSIQSLDTQVRGIVQSELKAMMCYLNATAELMQKCGMTEWI